MGNICYSFKPVVERVVHTKEVNSSYKENDCKIFFRVASISTPAKIVVRTSDTDCLATGISC